MPDDTFTLRVHGAQRTAHGAAITLHVDFDATLDEKIWDDFRRRLDGLKIGVTSSLSEVLVERAREQVAEVQERNHRLQMDMGILHARNASLETENAQLKANATAVARELMRDALPK